MVDRDQAQVNYYRSHASTYDATHIRDNDEHGVALRFMLAFMAAYHLRSVLDVGTGTGRAIGPLCASGFPVVGMEPVRALLDKAVEKGSPRSCLVQGCGEQLPFRDQAFDAVCEFGVLHHVRRPEHVVREMLRVARRAVFLSDTNRLGRARPVSRLCKLLLYKTKLWRIAYWIRKGGRSCDVSECDGIAYSYSVYDAFSPVNEWADRVVLVPTKVEGARLASWFHPLLTSSHVLLCGLREEG